MREELPLQPRGCPAPEPLISPHPGAQPPHSHQQQARLEPNEGICCGGATTTRSAGATTPWAPDRPAHPDMLRVLTRSHLGQIAGGNLKIFFLSLL